MLDFLADPKVIAAAITLGGTVWKAVYETRRRKAAERSSKTTTEAVERYSRTTSIYTVERYESIVTFDESGSGTLERRCQGIRVTQKVQELELPYGFGLAGPKATVGDPSLREISGSSSSFRLVRDDARSTSQAVHATIIAHDFLTPDTPPAGYVVTQPFSFGYLMTREEVEAAYDGTGWDAEYASIAVPVADCKQLTISVVFPASHRSLTPPPYGVVFEAKQEMLNDEQSTLYRNKVAYVGGIATLEVDRPKLGLRYAITWRSPRGK